MIRRFRDPALGMLLLLAPLQTAQGFLSRDTVEISFDVVVNDDTGSRRIACDAPTQLDGYSKHAWRVAIGEVETSDDSAPAVPAQVVCASTTASEPETRFPLRAEISTIARAIRQMEDERLIEVRVAIARKDASGSAPRASSTVLNRMMFFAQPRDAFLPLWIPDGDPHNSTAIREVFLRISVRSVRDESVAAYGTIDVSADLEGDLLLDGGRVGRITAEEPTILRNVRTGLRELRIRDASGREIEKTVRVRADRSARVELLANPSERPYRRSFIGLNEQGYEEYRRHADGAVAVKIPAGEFLMGNHDTERTPLEHPVYVSEFLMDKLGVTWGQYKAFKEATRMPLPRHRPYWGIHDDQPVVYVNWAEAREYCHWAGGRLPTEAEREKAARGTDERKYPWGNEPPDPERGVFRHSWGHEATEAVGSHPAGASPYGLHDMGGNVWEWCADWYDGEYYAQSPLRDPKGPKTGTAHVVRGGSWDSRPDVLSASCRSWGHRGYRDGDFGFRCAMNSPTRQPEP